MMPATPIPIPASSKPEIQVAVDGSAVAGLTWQSSLVELDTRGRVVAVLEDGRQTDYFHNDAGSVEHAYGPYDPVGGGTVPFKLWWYDSRGQVVEYEDDASGSTLFEYDELGRLDWSVDTLGRATTYMHDELGRLSERSTDDGTTTYAYDLTHNGAGLPSSVTGPWGSDTVTGYDLAGRPLGRTLSIAGLMGPQTTSMTYDHLGRVRTRTLPDTTVLSYDYGSGGALTGVSVDGVSFAQLSDYNARGQVGQRTTSASTTAYDYDAEGRLHEVVSEASGSASGPLMAYRYRHTNSGDVLGIRDIRDELGGSTMVAGIDTDDSWVFGYDALRRLSSAEAYDGTIETFTYDANDRVTQLGNVQVSYPPGRVTKGVEDGIVQFLLTRNAAGAVVNRGPGAPTSYTYNADDRLTAVTEGGVVQAEFVYGDGPRRLVKTERAPAIFMGAGPVNHTERYYISPNYEIEVHNDPSTGVWEQTVTKHIDAPGQGLIATITEPGLSTAQTAAGVASASAGPMQGSDRRGSPIGTWHYHANHLGSTSVVTDSTGAVVSRYIQDPFGRRNGRSIGYDAVARQYTGQPHDSSTGLYDYGARYYDPEAGVFMTADEHDNGMPYLPGGVLNPAGLNRFAYAFNNPVRYNDPTGHGPIDYLNAKFKEWWGDDASVSATGGVVFEPTPGLIVSPKNIAYKAGSVQADTDGNMTATPPVVVQVGAYTASGSLKRDKNGQVKVATKVGIAKTAKHGSVDVSATADLTLEQGKLMVQPGVTAGGDAKAGGVSLKARITAKLSKIELYDFGELFSDFKNPFNPSPLLIPNQGDGSAGVPTRR